MRLDPSQKHEAGWTLMNQVRAQEVKGGTICSHIWLSTGQSVEGCAHGLRYMVGSWDGHRQGKSWTWWSSWVLSNLGYYMTLGSKSCWCCNDCYFPLIPGARPEFGCFLQILFLSYISFNRHEDIYKKSLPSGLLIFPKSLPYSSNVPQGSWGSVYICLEEKWRLQIFKVVFSHPHSKGKQTHASNMLMLGFSFL